MRVVIQRVKYSSCTIDGKVTGKTDKDGHTVAFQVKIGDRVLISKYGGTEVKFGDEKYTFKDETGEVVVEIDDEDWRGVKVTPENTITINGEVDKEMFEPTKIDVDSVIVK